MYVKSGSPADQEIIDEYVATQKFALKSTSYDLTQAFSNLEGIDTIINDINEEIEVILGSES